MTTATHDDVNDAQSNAQIGAERSGASAAACCATFYEQAWVQAFLGDSFHPGGLALSLRLIDSLALSAGARVLDLACGAGSTALALADGYDVDVTAMDFSEVNLAKGRAAAPARGAEIEWVKGDVAELPFDDDTFDAVLCECALSTFEDKPRVLAEVRRVLKPGGQLGLSDMAVQGEVPPALAEVLGPWTCVADARSVSQYQTLLADAGLEPGEVSDESEALAALTVDIKRKLAVMGVGQMAGAAAMGAELQMPMDMKTARGLLKEARAVIDAGDVQYVRLLASLGEPVRGDGAKKKPKGSAECDPATGCC